MKKITSLVLVCALLVCCVFAFASCSMRFGKYEGEVDLGIYKNKVTIEFMMSNVTVTVKNTVLGSSNTDVYEGSFEITGKGDDMEIAFDFEEDCPIFSADSYTFYEGEDNDGKYIEIGLTRYDAAK